MDLHEVIFVSDDSHENYSFSEILQRFDDQVKECPGVGFSSLTMNNHNASTTITIVVGSFVETFFEITKTN